MPASILEDAANLKNRGKTTLGLLFVFGIVLLMYLMSNVTNITDTVKIARSEEVSAEVIKSKPEELSFLLPPIKPPRTKLERDKRTAEMIKNLNDWESKVENKQIAPQQILEASKNPATQTRELIKLAVSQGLIHPIEVKSILDEIKTLKIEKIDQETWGVNKHE